LAGVLWAAPPGERQPPLITVIDEAGQTHAIDADRIAQLPQHKVEPNDYAAVRAEFEG
jgi:hypothetical protein